jgi:hypothetical protein
MRITVIGAGIAGSALTRLARERGHDVSLVSVGPPASAAALAVARPSWLKLEDRLGLAFSLDWYRANGMLIATEAAVRNAKTPTEVKLQGGWYLIDPLAPLVAPDEERAVTRDDFHRGGPIVVCVGAGATFPPPRIGGTNWGSTATCAAAWEEAGHLPTLQVAHLRPYHSVMVACDGGHIRLGSSQGATPEAADRRLYSDLAVAEELGLVGRGWAWDIVRGQRVTVKAPRVQRNGNRYTMTNYGRLGYSLAPWDAHNVLEEIESGN